MKLEAEPLTMSYAALERTLLLMFQATAASGPAMMARFKYMQKSDFPNRRVGRGNRVGYRLDDVMQILLAFELLEFATPPGRAMRLVRSGWSDVRTALVTDWLVDRLGSDVRSFLVAVPASLAEAAAGPDVAERPLVDGFEIWSGEMLAGWAGRDDGARRLAVIDPRRLTDAFLSAASSDGGGGLERDPLVEAFEAWADRGAS